MLHKIFKRIIQTVSIENTRPGGGIGRRKGLKILESNLVPVRLRPDRKIFFLSSVLFIISACSNIPAPSLISPDENTQLQKVNYGSSPSNYQKILKDYLIKNLKNYKTAKVEFINEPSKLSIDHLGDNYSGYRVCLSINEQRGDYYIGYRNHFFMINNNSVSLHLYDSGLLTIPFEYCVTRDTTKEIFIDDIPDR